MSHFHICWQTRTSIKILGLRYEDLGAQSNGPTLLPIFRDEVPFPCMAKWGEALLYRKYKNACVLKEHHLTNTVVL